MDPTSEGVLHLVFLALLVIYLAWRWRSVRVAQMAWARAWAAPYMEAGTIYANLELLQTCLSYRRPVSLRTIAGGQITVGPHHIVDVLTRGSHTCDGSGDDVIKMEVLLQVQRNFDKMDQLRAGLEPWRARHSRCKWLYTALYCLVGLPNTPTTMADLHPESVVCVLKVFVILLRRGTNGLDSRGSTGGTLHRTFQSSNRRFIALCREMGVSTTHTHIHTHR